MHESTVPCQSAQITEEMSFAHRQTVRASSKLQFYNFWCVDISVFTASSQRKFCASILVCVCVCACVETHAVPLLGYRGLKFGEVFKFSDKCGSLGKDIQRNLENSEKKN